MKSCWVVYREWGGEYEGSSSQVIRVFEDREEAEIFQKFVEDEHNKLCQEYTEAMEKYYNARESWRVGGHKRPAYSGPEPKYPTKPQNQYDSKNEDWSWTKSKYTELSYSQTDYSISEIPYFSKGEFWS